jgi:hypothetical protein
MAGARGVGSRCNREIGATQFPASEKTSKQEEKEMTPQEMRAAHPLISTSPNYHRWLAAKAVRESIQRMMSPVVAAVTGYQDELQYILDAQSVYLGPGR